MKNVVPILVFISTLYVIMPACKKKASVPPPTPSGYASLVAGTRTWTHTTGIAANIGYTTFNHPDTSFAFSYVDSLTVALQKDTLRLYYQSDSIVTFAKLDTSNIYKQLFFNLKSDSMIYSIEEVIHPGRRNFEDFYTKR